MTSLSVLAGSTVPVVSSIPPVSDVSPALLVIFSPLSVLSLVLSGPVTRFIQASLSKIQGLFKDFSILSYGFQGLKDLSVKILLLKW